VLLVDENEYSRCIGKSQGFFRGSAELSCLVEPLKD
jgi:hypothetical protein